MINARAISADVLAGASVALVLVPQSLAYAELAGLPAHHGLYAAALAPIAAALLASSPYLQTGPTAMTSLLTVGALGAASGAGDAAGLAALLALLVGLLRLLLGLVHAGPLTFFLSPPVLQGFTAGAAVLILMSQLPIVLGVDPTSTALMARAADAISTPELWHLESLALAALSLLVIFGGRRVHALFPGVLVAAVGGILYAQLGDYGGSGIGAVPDGFVALELDLPWAQWHVLLAPALVIAVVGFAEPTAIARTFAAADRTRWHANRELMSQGAANIAAGVVGGFPVGGSFSRSALNRLAGARTRWSGAVTGIVVLALLPFASVLSPLPKPVLGAAIIASVVTLLRFGPLASMWRISWPQAAIAWATFGLTLALSPRIELAVIIGVALAVCVHMWREMRVGIVATREDDVLCIAPKGVLWFASAEQLQTTFLDELALHPSATRLVLDLGGLGRIDFTGAQALAELGQRARAAGLEVAITNAPPQTRRILGKVCASLLGPENGAADRHDAP